MRKLLMYSLIGLFLSSCNQNKSGQAELGSGSENVSNPQTYLNLQAESFSQIDSSDFLMYPLSMGESEGVRSSISYKQIPADNYWNIVFHNVKTNEHHLLSNRKMIIRSFDVKHGSNEPGDSKETSNYIFYTITTDDLNKDKKLTEEDPEYLFVSDKQGKGLRQISPTGTHLQNWKFLRKSNKLILTAYRDSDKNLKFDESDEIATFQVDMSSNSTPNEIFDTKFKTELKALYNKDWKLLDR